MNQLFDSYGETRQHESNERTREQKRPRLTNDPDSLVVVDGAHTSLDRQLASKEKTDSSPAELETSNPTRQHREGAKGEASQISKEDTASQGSLLGLWAPTTGAAPVDRSPSAEQTGPVDKAAALHVSLVLHPALPQQQLQQLQPTPPTGIILLTHPASQPSPDQHQPKHQPQHQPQHQHQLQPQPQHQPHHQHQHQHQPQHQPQHQLQLQPQHQQDASPAPQAPSVLHYPVFQGGAAAGAAGSQMLGMPPNALNATAAHFMVMAAASGLSTQQQQAMAMFMSQTAPRLPGTVSQPQPQLLALPGISNASRVGPLLYIPTDDDVLSENQIMLRKHIEFFEASLDDVGKTTSGRRRPIMLNQVGIQCRHCGSIPSQYRQKGAIYYPAKLAGIYQAAQNMAVTHLTNLCQHIDDKTKEQLQNYQQGRSTTGHGGKQYWAGTAKAQGIVEGEEGGLRFANSNQSHSSIGNHATAWPSNV